MTRFVSSLVRRLVSVPLVALLTACGSLPAPAPSAPGPGAEPAALRADDALRLALASGDPAPLEGALAGPALAQARRQVAEMARRGVRREEVLDGRRTVHAQGAGRTAEVVVEIRARQRLLVAGRAPAPAATVLRQWRAGLAWEDGRWLVVESGDLPPPQWWPS